MSIFGNVLKGAIKGGTSGAAVGSFLPGIGTAVGGVGGALFGGLSHLDGGAKTPNQRTGNFVTGYDSNVQQAPVVSPQQQDLMTQLGQMGLAGLQKSPDFAPIAQQARTNFAQNTLPSIAERFSGLGAQRSSAFGQQLGSAGSNLESSLASLQSQYDQGQQGLYQNLAQLGLGQQFQNQFNQAEPGLLQTLPPQILKILPALLQAYGYTQGGA